MSERSTLRIRSRERTQADECPQDVDEGLLLSVGCGQKTCTFRQVGHQSKNFPLVIATKL